MSATPGAPRRRRCPAPCAVPCAVSPALPDQGGVMPVLWQPAVVTSLLSTPNPTYTLVIIATQPIDVGVILRFQMWDGLNITYTNATLARFDLVIQRAIPASTLLTVSITPTGTCLFGYNSATQYSAVGDSVSLAYYTQYASLLCFAFVPTASGSWLPARGQPQFAIGFSYQPTQQGNCLLTPPLLTDPTVADTAPNFPDQFSGVTDPWVFQYEVVYPTVVPYGTTCYQIRGIKYRDDGLLSPIYANGCWSNLRQVIAQPLTVINSVYETVNNWVPYSTQTTLTLPPDNSLSAYVGPFTYAVAEGQLAVVYFKPLPGDYPVNNTAQTDKSLAEVGFVLTAPIPANTTVYATTQGYDSRSLGYGPNPGSLTASPSFRWVVGSVDLPAGTVIIISNLGGAGTPNVANAHDSFANVGSIVGWSSATPPVPVVSVIFLGAWQLGVPQRFITAALSAQYVGDFPLLSPALTIAPAPFVYPAIYGQGKTFTNLGLPGTVQSAMVNAGAFVTLDWGTTVDPLTLPTFLNMGTFTV